MIITLFMLPEVKWHELNEDRFMKLPRIVPPFEIQQSYLIGAPSQLRNDLRQGTDPVAILVACSDMLCEPDGLDFANPGEVLVIQNAGATIPPPPLFDDPPRASFLKLLSRSIRHIIVCGHIGCGVTSSLLKADDWSQHPIGRFLELIGDRLEALYSDRHQEDLPAILTQEVVLRQLTNLEAYPAVQTRAQEKNLLIHGWVRDAETNTIAFYDPERQQFCL